MAATPATAFTPVMTSLTGNISGTVESLPNASVMGARVRIVVGTITLASQVAATVVGVARLPIGAVPLGFLVQASVSLGSTTIALGNAANGNSAKYAAAATQTVTTPVWWGAAASIGVPITAGVDCVSAASVTGYEDVILTFATATAPSSGTLTILAFYSLD